MGRSTLAQQLWLDVPVQVRQLPAGTTKARQPRRAANEAASGNQLELHMVPRPRQDAAPPIILPRPVAAPVTDGASPTDLRPSLPAFTMWLRSQAKRGGVIGDLAKAAQTDRLFPKNGSADDVRARFSAVGADGDAFEALDYAEREFDRQSRRT
ncbi:hypothetical protein [Sphingomonas sp.]|uniref:hypothetical protein n=1 Tax=Sphingomonas sp. TaxID=28214 RepID=UPI003B3BB4BE